MTEAKEFLEEYAKKRGESTSVNMCVWTHNDMLEFARLYHQKRIDETVEEYKEKLEGNN